MGNLLNVFNDFLQYEGTLRLMEKGVDFLEKKDYSEIDVSSLVSELKSTNNVLIHILHGSVQIISGSLDEYPELKKVIEITIGDSFTKHPEIKERDYAYIYLKRADIVNGMNAEDRFIIEMKKLLTAARVRMYITYEPDGEIVITF